MDPNTYRTIMIGHTLAKLYGAIMEVELSNYMKTLNLRAPKHAEFGRAFSTTVDIRLSACPHKCTILLSALFLVVEIRIKKITLFHDEITSNQVKTMFQTFRKQRKELLWVCLCVCHMCVFTITRTSHKFSHTGTKKCYGNESESKH